MALRSVDFQIAHVFFRGLENDPDNIAECVAKGINVIEQDLDKGLGNFASNSFDIVVMTQARLGHQPSALLGLPDPDRTLRHLR